jgi:hypothetical protein
MAKLMGAFLSVLLGNAHRNTVWKICMLHWITSVRSEVFTAMRMMLTFSGFWGRVGSLVDANISEKHTVSIFRVGLHFSTLLSGVTILTKFVYLFRLDEARARAA